jgi:hypothetical protein
MRGIRVEAKRRPSDGQGHKIYSENKRGEEMKKWAERKKKFAKQKLSQ